MLARVSVFDARVCDLGLGFWGLFFAAMALAQSLSSAFGFWSSGPGLIPLQRFKESEQALFKPCIPDDEASPKFGLLHLVDPIISYPHSASPLILRNCHQASVGWIQ